MSLWSETEFQRIAAGTKLSERTLEACHDVLVDGVPGADVARKRNLLHAHISRSINSLRGKQMEMVDSATALVSDTTVLFKFAVLQMAKQTVGAGFDVRDASPGHTYEGPVVVNSHGFLVQRIGPTGVLHDIGALERLPSANSVLRITYPYDGVGKASVSEVLPVQATAVSVGR
jgi:hypothetical protein